MGIGLWCWVMWAIACIPSAYSSCQRTPQSITTPKHNGDNGFKINISGNPERYVPGEVYTVSLQGVRKQYSVQKFTGFMLVVEADRSPISHFGPQSVGTFQLYGDALTKHSEECPNAVIQTSSIPKSEIQVLWTAPPASSGCVKFRATVVEGRDVWFMDEGDLTKELCEDIVDNDDMQPEVINDCCACDEAKYEVTFEGLWSRQTHPKDFPTNEWLTHFSDIIGASHSADYRVWEYGGYASDGLRQVAEWGSTRTLESELKRQSDHIRTIIKARGLWYPNVNGKTFAVFRVDNRHHLMSLVSMLGPTPDWIVGVSALELCLANCTWVDEKTLNLYPWDAGTDSGITYESDNQPTIPRERIRRITNSSPNDNKSPFYNPTGDPMKALARLTIKRQRVYEKSCTDTGIIIDDIVEYPEEDDAQRPECQVTNWGRFSPCSHTCGQGIRSRTREYQMPMKAQMMGCDRQLEQKEMCDGHGQGGFCPESIEDRICATSEWSAWTSCTETCGTGFRMRNRHYLDHMGRKKCNKDLTQKEMCGGTSDCPDAPEDHRSECSVTPWTNFSPCSVTCGQGIIRRQRHYLVPAGSQHCNVQTLQTQSCVGEFPDCSVGPDDAPVVCSMEQDVGPCRGYFRKWYFNKERNECMEFTYRGCKGNRNRFDSYDECIRACQFNTPLLQADRHTTGPTIGIVAESRVIKIDCMVTPWTEFGPCSKTCGRGRREKTRMIKVEPQNGGKKCPKKLVKRRRCINPKCNKGYSGLQSYSHRREGEVREVVTTSTVPPNDYYQHHREAGPYDAYNEYIAPGLFNPPMPHHNPNFDTPTSRNEDYHYIDRSPDNPYEYVDLAGREEEVQTDCVMGEWGPWSPCTHSCGSESLQQRSRNVVEPPRGDGAKCGDRYERRYCTLPPCPHSRG